MAVIRAVLGTGKRRGYTYVEGGKALMKPREDQEGGLWGVTERAALAGEGKKEGRVRAKPTTRRREEENHPTVGNESHECR